MKRRALTRIISSALTLCLAGIGVACMPATTVSASSQPVQLNYATNWSINGYHNPAGEICVQKLGTDEKVTLHYTTDGTNWADKSATYVKDDPNNPGYEDWHFGLSGEYEISGTIKSFTIKYEVNGQTYWDNNNGTNYNFASDDNVIFGKSNVVFTADGEGDRYIFVKNIDYTKKVGVRYTTDNWATYHDVNASYFQSLTGADQFSFPSEVPTGAKFAAYYTVDGVTYWDNNFGSDYTIY